MGGTGGGLSWLLLWWAELTKTLICLSADGQGWIPSLLIVLPEAAQHWSLPWLFGGVSGGLWECSRHGVLCRASAVSVLVLMLRHCHPLPLQKTFQH